MIDCQSRNEQSISLCYRIRSRLIIQWQFHVWSFKMTMNLIPCSRMEMFYCSFGTSSQSYAFTRCRSCIVSKQVISVPSLYSLCRCCVSPSIWPLRQYHDWLSVSQVVWTQIRVHWWMKAHTYRQWSVWKTAGAWWRGLITGLFVNGSSNSACQKLLLQCQVVWWLMNCELEMMLQPVVVA
jgi:hypothetical protein